MNISFIILCLIAILALYIILKEIKLVVTILLILIFFYILYYYLIPVGIQFGNIGDINSIIQNMTLFK